jgi:hypothetical protein
MSSYWSHSNIRTERFYSLLSSQVKSCYQTLLNTITIYLVKIYLPGTLLIKSLVESLEGAESVSIKWEDDSSVEDVEISTYFRAYQLSTVAKGIASSWLIAYEASQATCHVYIGIIWVIVLTSEGYSMDFKLTEFWNPQPTYGPVSFLISIVSPSFKLPWSYFCLLEDQSVFLTQQQVLFYR